MKAPSVPTQLLLTASVATFLIAFDSSVLYVAFPAIVKDFPGLSTGQLSWVINAYSVGLASLLVPAGYFADAFGRKRVFLAGLVIFAVASIGCAAANSVSILIASRVLQAVGGAFVLPSSLATIVAFFSGHQRMAAVGKWSAVGGIAASIAPPAGAAILHFTSWRMIFLLNAPICLLGFLLASRVFTDSCGTKIARSFAIVMPFLTIGIGLIATSILIGRGSPGFTRWILLALGLAIFIATIRVIALQPTLRPVLGKSDVIWAGAATACFGAAFSCMFIAYTLALVHRFALPIPLAGLMMTPIPLLSVPVAGRAGRLAARFGAPRLIVIGAISSMAGALLFAILLRQDSFSLPVWLIIAVLSSTGIGFCFPLLSIVGIRSVMADYFAIGSGVNQSSRQMGSVLGVAATSMLLTTLSPGSFARAMILLITLSAGTMLCMIGGTLRGKA